MARKKSRSNRTRRLWAECLEPRHLLAAALNLQFMTNGLDGDALPGPLIPLGGSINWNYNVTNTGDVPLTNVSISDDNGTPLTSQDDFSPSPILAAPNARGALEQTFDLNAGGLVADPKSSYVYATVPSSNSVVVINTQTLQQESTISVTSASGRLALSPDGSRLYVAGSSISVIDTKSRTVLQTFPIACSDIAVGANGKLYVLTSQAVLQINSQTGQSAGPNVGSAGMVYSGELAISPTGDRLYYGNFALSPASLYQFDLTVSPAKQLWSNMPNDLSASNGQDLAITSDGAFISFACGYGQGGYRIAKYRTSDMAIVGTFNTGAYPREVTYSPDGLVAYTVHTNGQIDTWDTGTFASLGSIATPDEAYGLLVDSNGADLFALMSSKIYVYGTGRGGSINVGDVNRNYKLDPGETWQYAAHGTAQNGQQTHATKVTAVDASSHSVSSQDTSSYYGMGWQIDVQGAVQSLDADQPTGPTVRAGAALPLTYIVTNPGTVSLTNVSLVDDHGTPNDVTDDFAPMFSGGDANGDGLLESGETWQYSATIVAAPGSALEQVIAKADAVNAQGNVIANALATDSDPTSYFGAVSALAITTTVNGDDANTPPGHALLPGDQAVLTYRVTNTGNVPLANVTLADNAGTPGNSTDDFLPDAIAAGPIPQGTLEASFGYSASSLLVDPNGPYLYAAVPSLNSVAVINTQTLAQEAMIFVGSGLQGMALSLDGSRLYVAEGTTNLLGVIDTKARTLVSSITLSQRPHDVEVGADGRLYVLGDSYGSIMQIDPQTGQSAGPNLTGAFVYGGELAISPNKDRLYYGDSGLSPATLYQFDLTVSPPKLLWTNKPADLSASNGQNLTITNDGSFVSFACGAGQGGYRIAKYRTTDMVIVGTFDTGAYPREITYSPDNAIAYTTHKSGQIDVWDANTFLSLGGISTGNSQANQLVVDRSGGHLFASLDSELRIYATGRGPAAQAGDANRNSILDPGETWSYTATRSVAPGPQTSIDTATATDVLNASVVGQVTTYYAGDRIPAVNDRVFTALEDHSLLVQAGQGVLADITDPDGDALSAVLVSKPAHGVVTLNSDGGFSYQPDGNYNGDDHFSYHVDDGLAASADAKVTISVSPVNDAPSFKVGANQLVTDLSGARSIGKWATNIAPGPADESGQNVQFVILSNSNSELFAALPAVDSSGNLTFTPRERVEGSAQIAVAIKDDGGTDDDGRNTSESQIFTIQVNWDEPWHNRTLPEDVSGDEHVVAGDAIDVINYVNGKGAGPLDFLHAAAATVIGGDIGHYYDVTGDNYVASNDIIAVINYINSHNHKQTTQPAGEAGSASGDGTGDLLLMLAADVAEQTRLRK